MAFGVLFGHFVGVFLDPFGCLGATFGRLLVNFRSFGVSFWDVCRVLSLFGRFGEDLQGFWGVSDQIFNISR